MMIYGYLSLEQTTNVHISRVDLIYTIVLPSICTPSDQTPACEYQQKGTGMLKTGPVNYTKLRHKIAQHKRKARAPSPHPTLHGAKHTSQG
jgi:hypothetical protein